MKHSTTLLPMPSATDDDNVVAELRQLKSRRSPRGPRVTRALQILGDTSSARVRNAAALALADMRAEGAEDRLIDLLARAETKGSRGSLLYALDRLAANVPLSILAEIIAHDSYEAREEALAFIARNRFECSTDEVISATAALEAAIASAEAEQRQAIQKTLKYLRMRYARQPPT